MAIAASPFASSADPALNPNQHQRQAVRRHCFFQEPDPRPGERYANQPGDAGIDMHHRPAGEVDRPGLENEAVRRPHHMRDRRVNDGHEQ